MGPKLCGPIPPKALTAPSAKPASWQPTRNISTPISTVIQPTGAPTTPAPANEILEQTRGRITHFVAGLGTTGTFMGVTRRLKEENPNIECISMQPDSPFHGLEGLKHMATAIVPAIYDPKLADRNLEVETEAAYTMAKRLARTEGLLVGVSSAAAVAAALRIAEEQAALGKDAVIVTILPDAADKYLSERFWEE